MLDWVTGAAGGVEEPAPPLPPEQADRPSKRAHTPNDTGVRAETETRNFMEASNAQKGVAQRGSVKPVLLNGPGLTEPHWVQAPYIGGSTAQHESCQPRHS